MRVAITGPTGFLAWHTRCALLSRGEPDAIGIGRMEFESPSLLDAALVDVDVVIHLAGVNRSTDPNDVERTNVWLAEQLATGLRRAERPISVIYGNSIQALGGSVFGSAKRASAELLGASTGDLGSAFVDVLLPNIFGEHGRPYYNSVVATFCHQIAMGDQPRIDEDRELPLLHAQRAAAILIDAAMSPEAGVVSPSGTPVEVSDLLRRLQAMSGRYRDGLLPDLSDGFTRDLFNTYRSFTFPKLWPVLPVKHEDERGSLVEVVRARGGETQVFFSTTNPGFTRGGHFHLQKVERFLVLDGQASIKLRRLFTDEVVEFEVNGDEPAIIDMPTMWTHSITNIGTKVLTTLFYADDEFDPADPDTYWVSV